MADLGEDSGDILLIGRESDAAEMYRMKLVLDGYRVITIADVAVHRDGWRPDLVLINLVVAAAGTPLLALHPLQPDPCPAAAPPRRRPPRPEEDLREVGAR